MVNKTRAGSLNHFNGALNPKCCALIGGKLAHPALAHH